MKNKNLLGTAQLLVAAFIWGSTFVAQAEGMNFVGPLTYITVRFAIGGAVLIPVFLLKDLFIKKRTNVKPKTDLKILLVGGFICGVILTIAATLQQYGIIDTSVGNAGFITTLYVVFVPICGIFFKKFPSLNVWVAVIIATVGLYLLCITDRLVLGIGDTLVLLCAVCFTFHILALDYFVPKVDPIKLSCVQFLTVSLLTAIPAIVLEHNSITAILNAWFPILWAGVLSSGVAYTLQTVAQKNAEPTIAAITMSLESVFAIISGAVVLGDIPTPRKLIGSIIMFLAIILAQLPAKWFRFKKI